MTDFPPQRLALLAAITLGCAAASPVLAQQGAPGNQPQLSQQEACAKLARRLERVQTNQGVQEAVRIYHRRIAKLATMYGPQPCPAVRPPAPGPNIK